jgi:S-adenosylhomocysteine hydrolase
MSDEELELAQQSMPQIMDIVKKFIAKQPLKGIRDTQFVLYG